MTNGNRSGSGSKDHDDGKGGRGRRRSCSAESAEDITQPDAPQGQSSSSARDENSASRQATRSSSATRGGLGNSRWNSSRNASRNDKQRDNRADNQVVVSRKRARDDDDFRVDDRGVKFAKHGGQVLKDRTGQVADLKPTGGTIKDGNFWSSMPQSIGMVGGKFEPGTALGQATLNTAAQQALSASSTSSVLFMLAPVKRLQHTTPLAFMSSRPRNTLEAMKNAEVPYRSKGKAKASDKDQDKDKTCGNCDKVSHKTGECPRAALRHGDTAVCPLCNVIASVHTLDTDKPFDATLQRRSRKVAGCPKLTNFWSLGYLPQIFNDLVVNRLRKPALRVRDKRNCFLNVVFKWADRAYRGQMPPEMNGMWPYTKEDAVKFADELERFDEIGLDKMPKSSLESMTFAEVRKAYEKGDIRPQVFNYNERIHQRVSGQLRSAEVERGEPADDCGDVDMDNGSKKNPMQMDKSLDEFVSESVSASGDPSASSSKRAGTRANSVALTSIEDLPDALDELHSSDKSDESDSSLDEPLRGPGGKRVGTPPADDELFGSLDFDDEDLIEKSTCKVSLRPKKSSDDTMED